MSNKYKKSLNKRVFHILPSWVFLIIAAGISYFFWFGINSISIPNVERDKLMYLLDIGLRSKFLRQTSGIISAFLVFVSILRFIKESEKKKLFLSLKSIDAIKRMPWQEFEILVGAVYRKLGYKVEETGLGGADGGVDLIMYKKNEKVIVQCKRWSTTTIGAPIVREMYGLMTHHKAQGVKIVCVGKFTRDARAFAEGKPIDLVTGLDLLKMINI
jgi:restriction system protein